jgi:hypothetical protein
MELFTEIDNIDRYRYWDMPLESWDRLNGLAGWNVIIMQRRSKHVPAGTGTYITMGNCYARDSPLFDEASNNMQQLGEHVPAQRILTQQL